MLTDPEENLAEVFWGSLKMLAPTCWEVARKWQASVGKENALISWHWKIRRPHVAFVCF